jgi:hypothetical protein
LYKQDPKLQGLVLDLRNDPGGLLDAAVALSAAFLPENVTVVSTNGQLEESKFIYKAAPQFWRRSSDNDPIQRLTQNTQGQLKKFRWWSWSMKAPLQPAKLWRAHCKITSVQPSWAVKLLAKAPFKRFAN